MNKEVSNVWGAVMTARTTLDRIEGIAIRLPDTPLRRELIKELAEMLDSVLLIEGDISRIAHGDAPSVYVDYPWGLDVDLYPGTRIEIWPAGCDDPDCSPSNGHFAYWPWRRALRKARGHVIAGPQLNSAGWQVLVRLPKSAPVRGTVIGEGV